MMHVKRDANVFSRLPLLHPGHVSCLIGATLYLLCTIAMSVDALQLCKPLMFISCVRDFISSVISFISSICSRLWFFSGFSFFSSYLLRKVLVDYLEFRNTIERFKVCFSFPMRARVKHMGSLSNYHKSLSSKKKEKKKEKKARCLSENWGKISIRFSWREFEKSKLQNKYYFCISGNVYSHFFKYTKIFPKFFW